MIHNRRRYYQTGTPAAAPLAAPAVTPQYNPTQQRAITDSTADPSRVFSYGGGNTIAYGGQLYDTFDAANAALGGAPLASAPTTTPQQAPLAATPATPQYNPTQQRAITDSAADPSRVHTYGGGNTIAYGGQLYDTADAANTAFQGYLGSPESADQWEFRPSYGFDQAYGPNGWQYRVGDQIFDNTQDASIALTQSQLTPEELAFTQEQGTPITAQTNLTNLQNAYQSAQWQPREDGVESRNIGGQWEYRAPGSDQVFTDIGQAYAANTASQFTPEELAILDSQGVEITGQTNPYNLQQTLDQAAAPSATTPQYNPTQQRAITDSTADPSRIFSYGGGTTVALGGQLYGSLEEAQAASIAQQRAENYAEFPPHIQQILDEVTPTPAATPAAQPRPANPFVEQVQASAPPPVAQAATAEGLGDIWSSNPYQRLNEAQAVQAQGQPAPTYLPTAIQPYGPDPSYVPGTPQTATNIPQGGYAQPAIDAYFAGADPNWSPYVYDGTGVYSPRPTGQIDYTQPLSIPIGGVDDGGAVDVTTGVNDLPEGAVGVVGQPTEVGYNEVLPAVEPTGPVDVNVDETVLPADQWDDVPGGSTTLTVPSGEEVPFVSPGTEGVADELGTWVDVSDVGTLPSNEGEEVPTGISTTDVDAAPDNYQGIPAVDEAFTTTYTGVDSAGETFEQPVVVVDSSNTGNLSQPTSINIGSETPYGHLAGDEDGTQGNPSLSSTNQLGQQESVSIPTEYVQQPDGTYALEVVEPEANNIFGGPGEGLYESITGTEFGDTALGGALEDQFGYESLADLVDGGGPGQAGEDFEGGFGTVGLAGDAANALGIDPIGAGEEEAPAPLEWEARDDVALEQAYGSDGWVYRDPATGQEYNSIGDAQADLKRNSLTPEEQAAVDQYGLEITSATNLTNLRREIADAQAAEVAANAPPPAPTPVQAGDDYPFGIGFTYDPTSVQEATDYVQSGYEEAAGIAEPVTPAWEEAGYSSESQYDKRLDAAEWEDTNYDYEKRWGYNQEGDYVPEYRVGDQTFDNSSDASYAGKLASADPNEVSILGDSDGDGTYEYTYGGQVYDSYSQANAASTQASYEEAAGIAEPTPTPTPTTTTSEPEVNPEDPYGTGLTSSDNLSAVAGNFHGPANNLVNELVNQGLTLDDVTIETRTTVSGKSPSWSHPFGRANQQASFAVFPDGTSIQITDNHTRGSGLDTTTASLEAAIRSGESGDASATFGAPVSSSSGSDRDPWGTTQTGVHGGGLHSGFGSDVNVGGVNFAADPDGLNRGGYAMPRQYQWGTQTVAPYSSEEEEQKRRQMQRQQQFASPGGGLGSPQQGPLGQLGDQLKNKVIDEAATAIFGPVGTFASSFFNRGTTNAKVSKLYNEGYKAPGQAYAIAKSMGYGKGTPRIPGYNVGVDTVPSMLTPGEAVIPAEAAQHPANKPMINNMIQHGRAIQDGQRPPQMPAPMPMSKPMQGPLSGKQQRENLQVTQDLSLKKKSWAADERRKEDVHKQKMEMAWMKAKQSMKE